MPWEKGVSLTPLPELQKVAYLTDCIRDAEAKGARVMNEGGGASPERCSIRRWCSP